MAKRTKKGTIHQGIVTIHDIHVGADAHLKLKDHSQYLEVRGHVVGVGVLSGTTEDAFQKHPITRVMIDFAK